jgi:hypothetical protein
LISSQHFVFLALELWTLAEGLVCVLPQRKGSSGRQGDVFHDSRTRSAQGQGDLGHVASMRGLLQQKARRQLVLHGIVYLGRCVSGSSHEEGKFVDKYQLSNRTVSDTSIGLGSMCANDVP